MATKASRIALAGSNISSTGEVDADLLDNIDSAAFLSLDSNGRLGIGASTLTAPLNIQADGDARTLRIIGRSDDYSEIDFYENDNSTILSRIQAHNTMFNLRAYNVPIQFQQSNNTKMTIAADGNVGIGTNSPAAPLDFGVTSTGQQVLLLRQNGASRTGFSISDNYGVRAFGPADALSTGSLFGVGEMTSSTNYLGDLFTVQYDGNVGIGTTSPDTLLEIRKDTASTGYGDYPILSIRNDNASGYGAIHFQEGSSQSARVEVGNNSGTPYMGLYTTSAASGITIKGGNVGIGRTSPQSRLDVLSSARITSSANTSHAFKLEARAGFANDGNSSCIWVSDGGSSSDPLFSSQGAHLVIECRQSAGRHIYFKVGNTTTAQHIMSSDGRMGIGTTSPSERLHVSGNILASGSVTQNSDISLKDNITPIPNALDKVLQIRGVTYNRNDIEDNPRDAGVIAQEVERVLPEVVSQCENGIKSVAYGNMVGLLIEAIRELSAEIEDLKSQNNL
jgi:hypothetical protein